MSIFKEEFIKKCIEKYGNEFSYEKTVYKNISTKIVVTDKNGIDHEVWPQYFLYKSKNKNLKCTTENVIQKSKEIFGQNTYSYEKVKCSKSSDTIIITCPIHGDFYKTVNAHINCKQGCPKCGYQFVDTNKFIENARKIHGDKYDYSKVEYVNSQTKVCIICKKCGYEFWQTPNAHLKGNGCKNCQRLNHILSVDEFITSSKLQERKIELISNYVNASTICKFKCNNCGYEWDAIPFKIKSGRGCPSCAGKGSGINGMCTTEEFIKKARKVHGDKYDYSKVEYKGAYMPICIICHKKDKDGKEHGEFWQTPITHLNSNGCQKCNETKLERIIRKFCDKYSIKYTYQAGKKDGFDWLGLQSLDFYLPDYNIAIECQGVQHFKPVNHFGGIKNYEETVLKDKEKYKKCYENNIKLMYFTKNDLFTENYFTKLYTNPEKLFKDAGIINIY